MVGMLQCFAVVAVVAAGCGGAYWDLPTADRDAFERCGRKLRESLCPDGAAGDFCMGDLGDAYSAEAPAQRSRWLVAHGCPADMVAAGATAPTPLGSTTQTACEPACRSGFTCVRGACVSACNPPCGPSEGCSAAGECEPTADQSQPSSPTPTPAP